MSMRKGMHGTLLLSLIIVSPSLASESPGLGVPVSEAEIAATNFVVMPNGEGLPAGSGDSIRGAYVYQENCLVCHGVEGKDGINDVLVGGHGTITKGVPNKTAFNDHVLGQGLSLAALENNVISWLRQAQKLPGAL